MIQRRMVRDEIGNLRAFDSGNHRRRTGGEATTVEDSTAVRHAAKSSNPEDAVE
jgi:hypothetical protein